MNTEITLGATTIAGQVCYVIEDHIAPTATPDTTHIADMEGSSIACPSLEIAQRREQTKLPIYGVWQILLASEKLRALDWDKDYYITIIHPADAEAEQAEQRKKLFIYKTDQNQITTGDLEAHDAHKAEAITFDIEELVLPEQPIRSLSEIAREQREKRKANLSLAILCGLSILISYSVSYWLTAQEMTSLSRTHDALHKEEVRLKQNIDDKTQHQIKRKVFGALYPIAYMRQRKVPMQIESMVFAKPPYRVIVSDIPKHQIERAFASSFAPSFSPLRITKLENYQNGKTTIAYQ